VVICVDDGDADDPWWESGDGADTGWGTAHRRLSVGGKLAGGQGGVGRTTDRCRSEAGRFPVMIEMGV